MYEASIFCCAFSHSFDCVGGILLAVLLNSSGQYVAKLGISHFIASLSHSALAPSLAASSFSLVCSTLLDCSFLASSFRSIQFSASSEIFCIKYVLILSKDQKITRLNSS